MTRFTIPWLHQINTLTGPWFVNLLAHSFSWTEEDVDCELKGANVIFLKVFKIDFATGEIEELKGVPEIYFNI